MNAHTFFISQMNICTDRSSIMSENNVHKTIKDRILIWDTPKKSHAFFAPRDQCALIN